MSKWAAAAHVILPGWTAYYLCECVELPLMDTHSNKPGGRAGKQESLILLSHKVDVKALNRSATRFADKGDHENISLPHLIWSKSRGREWGADYSRMRQRSPPPSADGILIRFYNQIGDHTYVLETMCCLTWVCWDGIVCSWAAPPWACWLGCWPGCSSSEPSPGQTLDAAPG